MAPQANPSDNLSAALYGAKDFRLEQRPIPSPKSGELLVRIHTVGLCGTDLHFWRHGAFGSQLVVEPTVIGHEVSGTVVQVGKMSKDMLSLRVGDRVVMDPNITCEKCEYCKAGKGNLCIDLAKFSAFTRVVAQPAEYCSKLPPICLWKREQCWSHFVELFTLVDEPKCNLARLFIFVDLGAIGVLCLISAKAMGASKIIATDLSDKRLAIAKQVGADCVLNVSGKSPQEAAAAIKETLGCEPEITIECTGFGVSI
uniref:Sorbitol dehydrogenase n=1 Tax=Ditylenchus dipsaci TaxID=166011 RepID=A0A915EIV2_9BILA